MKKESVGQFTVLNDRGLHTRPSTEIVKAISRFKCEVTLKYKSLEVNARSLLGVLMLAAERGAKIQIWAKGEDAELAVNTLLDLSKEKFHIKY